MKQFTYQLRFTALAALAVFAFACGKNVDPEPTPEPEPEPEVKIDCQQVYFDITGLENFTLVDAEKAGKISLKVCREKADAAITVPVVTKVSDETVKITAPSEVAFGAADKETTVEISYPEGLPVKTPITIELTLTGEHVDAFLDKGSSVASTQIIAPEKVRALAHIEEYVGDDQYAMKDKYGMWFQDMLIVSDDYIILKNFIKSDFDVVLTTYDTPTNYGEKHFNVSSTFGYEYVDKDGYKSWEFANKDESGYVFYPFGKDSWFSIEYLSLMNDQDGEDYWENYYYPSTKWMNISCLWNDYSDTDDNTGVYYDYIILDWSKTDVVEVPAARPVAYGAVAYLASDSANKVNGTAEISGDGLAITISGILDYGTLVAEFDEAGNLTGFSGTYLKYYEDYTSYWGEYLYFSPSAKSYNFYLYYPSDKTFYDADAKKFSLDLYTYYAEYDNDGKEVAGTSGEGYDNMIIELVAE